MTWHRPPHPTLTEEQYFIIYILLVTQNTSECMAIRRAIYDYLEACGFGGLDDRPN